MADVLHYHSIPGGYAPKGRGKARRKEGNKTAIRLFGADRAFFLNDLEGPMNSPHMRITRRGVGGRKAIVDDPVSIVYYGANQVPVSSPGRNLSVEEERDFTLQQASFMPAVARKFLGVAQNFNPFAGRIGITRDWQGRPK